jgi:hypothetical protein
VGITVASDDQHEIARLWRSRPSRGRNCRYVFVLAAQCTNEGPTGRIKNIGRSFDGIPRNLDKIQALININIQAIFRPGGPGEHPNQRLVNAVKTC